MTGQKREVDIAIETKVGTHPFVFGIECRDRGRPADVTWIEQIAGKHQDLVGVNKTIAVARNGFTQPALVKATQRKIDAFALGEANEADWVRYTSRLSTLEWQGVEVIVRIGRQVGVLVTPPSPPPYPPPPELGREEECILNDPAGKAQGSIEQIVNLTLDEPAVRAQIEQEATRNSNITADLELDYFNGSYVVDAAGTKHLVAQVVIKAKFYKEATSIALRRANYGSTSVLHGAGEVAGQSIQVAWTEGEDGQLMFGASFGQPDGRS